MTQDFLQLQFHVGIFAHWIADFKEQNAIHCVKSVRIGRYSGQHFSAFCRIRTEYGDILRI